LPHPPPQAVCDVSDQWAFIDGGEEQEPAGSGGGDGNRRGMTFVGALIVSKIRRNSEKWGCLASNPKQTAAW